MFHPLHTFHLTQKLFPGKKRHLPNFQESDPGVFENFFAQLADSMPGPIGIAKLQVASYQPPMGHIQKIYQNSQQSARLHDMASGDIRDEGTQHFMVLRLSFRKDCPHVDFNLEWFSPSGTSALFTRYRMACQRMYSEPEPGGNIPFRCLFLACYIDLIYGYAYNSGF